jgi:hypothetical protein
MPGGETTQVAMLSEVVTMIVMANPNFKEGAIAKTTAFFTMRNQGAVAEHLQVRFPLRANLVNSGEYPEIGDLIAKVNGRVVPTTRQELPYTL